MRMRKKKHGAERIAALSYLLATPQTLYAQRDNLQALFGNDHPVSLEIGCGNGSFIVELARRFPQRNFIAMERVSDVILTAMECCARAGLSNIRFLIADAQFLPDYFAPGSIQTIYLNFSDPWPKKGYAKRRLTHANFLKLYRDILPQGGTIQFKTDNQELFMFSLEQFTACGFALSEITDDLHASQWQTDNIETEYEKNFSSKGFPIHRCVATILPL